MKIIRIGVVGSFLLVLSTSQTALAVDKNIFVNILNSPKLVAKCSAEAKKDNFSIDDIERYHKPLLKACVNYRYEEPNEFAVWAAETLYIKSKRLSFAYSITKEINSKIEKNENVDCISLVKALSSMCPEALYPLSKLEEAE